MLVRFQEHCPSEVENGYVCGFCLYLHFVQGTCIFSPAGIIAALEEEEEH